MLHVISTIRSTHINIITLDGGQVEIVWEFLTKGNIGLPSHWFKVELQQLNGDTLDQYPTGSRQVKVELHRETTQ